MIHNHPHPVRVMWTSDPQAYERMWFTSQDRTGDLLVVTGMGIYPNLGTAEAFAIVNVRGRHTTVRGPPKARPEPDGHGGRTASLRPGRAVPRSGGSGSRRIRSASASTSRGPTPSDRCTGCSAGERSSAPGRSPAWPATTASAGSRAGSTPAASGSRSGPTATCGTRDHHWGTRDGVGGPALWSGFQHPHSGEWVEFDDFGVWGDHILYNLGDERRGSETLRGRRHRLRFEPDTHLLLSGEVDLVFATGEEKTMAFERLGQPDRLPPVRDVRRARTAGPPTGTSGTGWTSVTGW